MRIKNSDIKGEIQLQSIIIIFDITFFILRIKKKDTEKGHKEPRDRVTETYLIKLSKRLLVFIVLE